MSEALAAAGAGRLASGGTCARHALVLEQQEYVEGLGYLQVLSCVSCDARIRRHSHKAESAITLF